ncbi:Heme-responsive zinc finger transcription factor HAP1 [Gossypium arboreum]|uniref:Heme-responsive zinc finger transcription factor HAP1 n=1 Tax=Gossypium arboreum TaxID=29729 RepID=A0A0B0NTV9_GOSAR|nr:Heme-responsive zinc finger transcription factor HAP1 [Gossypium arboreum]
MEKIDLYRKLTRPGALTTGWSNRTRACPRQAQAFKSLFQHLMRHLEETHGVEGKELLKESRLIHLRSRIHRQD